MKTLNPNKLLHLFVKNIYIEKEGEQKKNTIETTRKYKKYIFVYSIGLHLGTKKEIHISHLVLLSRNWYPGKQDHLKTSKPKYIISQYHNVLKKIEEKRSY